VSIYYNNKESGLKLLLLYGFLILISSIKFNQELFSIKNISIIPEISYIAIYHFYIFKRRISLFFVFLLGIWHDATLNIPIGSTSLCFIVVILLFSFFENITFRKSTEKIGYIKFFYFILCCAFLKYIILNIANNISNSYHIISFALSSFLLYIIIFAHFFEYIDKKIFKK